MDINKMQKEELELLSYKDITNLLLEKKGKQNTSDLFKKIVELLSLPSSVFESKIGDYYMMLTTDKRFIVLEDGTWDLRERHTSDKLNNIEIDEELEEIEESSNKNKDDIEIDEDDIDIQEYENDTDDDYKDLVIVDEDELDLEE